MIQRRWKSTIRSSDRAEYVRYIARTGVVDYLNTPGNLGCQMLTRDMEDGSTEVTTLSWWESMESIRAFAGDDVDRARYYPQDDKFLLEKPERVEHHKVAIDAVGVGQRTRLGHEIGT
ncbi:MAG: hypothetical protein H0W65_02890 [Sphingomonas sp.]|nr:hypothetical protein [Sphingomonas sp.]